TALASLLDYGTKMAVGLIITPVLLGGLGRSLYGVWEMLSRLVNYIAATDGRPTEALRLIVANHQATADSHRQRRNVGSALLVWLVFLPLVAGVGALLTWIAPTITRVTPDLHGTVRLACLLLVVSFLVASLAAVPESVLRGMNLGYRQMGLQASLNVVSAVLMAGAVAGGLGLAGVAGAQIATGAAAGLCFWVLARKYVAWFGAERPRRKEVREMLGVSGWLAVGDLVAKLLLASDVIVLGMLISPAVVTTYVVTGYAAKTAGGIHTLTVGAAMPGMGGMIGRGERGRTADLRHEILALTWLFVTVVGGTILLWNRSFVSLWVGPDNYAGVAIDFFIVVAAVQTAFIRADAYIIDAALRPRQRVFVGALAAATTLALELLLTRAFGLPGLCVGVVGGRTLQSVAYPVIARGLLRHPGGRPTPRPSLPKLARPAVMTVLLFAAAAYLNGHLLAPNWAVWIAGVVATGVLLAGAATLGGLNREERAALYARVSGVRRTIGGPR
ncbi:MAG: oligosaccharide flippase family protein, partial [Gemmatimonadetes bacterium]|nr:oligosaccharide flippase family protein [Gemmatimonadota bacterium]